VEKSIPNLKFCKNSIS